jgi:hypothetical protein
VLMIYPFKLEHDDFGRPRKTSSPPPPGGPALI